MKKNNLILSAALLASSLGFYNANAQFSLSGELTPRTEFRNGFKKPIVEGQDPALFTEQRTRLNFGYTSEKYDVVVSFQDVRIWGSTDQIYKTDGGMQNIYEGYGKYKFSSKSNIKIGRMALDYDNARFMGNLGWAMQARSHDGMVYETKFDSAGTTTLHAGLFFNQDGTTPEFKKLTGMDKAPGNYKSMAYLWFNKKLSDKSSFSLLAHNNVNQSATGINLAMQTFGGVGKFGLIGTEAYYQTGIGSDYEVSALYFDLHANLKAGKLSITPGFEYLSGDDGKDGIENGFNPLYGTNHKFNGYMDYFYVGNAHGNVGLINPYINTKTKLTAKTALVADLHVFMADKGIADKMLGTELDLVLVSKLADGVTFKIGQSFLNATDSMKAIKNNGVVNPNQKSLNTWSWAQIIFTPKFL